MIDLRHPLTVLTSRLPWAQIEAALAPRFARQVLQGCAVAQDDLLGQSLQLVGAGVAAAGRPHLPLRLMASLLYLKHTYKLSDEQLEQVRVLTEDTATQPKQVVVDLGFRGVDADNLGAQIIHRGNFKSLTAVQRRWLKVQSGDALHMVLCAAGYNIRWRLQHRAFGL